MCTIPRPKYKLPYQWPKVASGFQLRMVCLLGMIWYLKHSKLNLFMIFQSAVQTCQGRQFQFQNIIYRLQTPIMYGKWPIINKVMCITQMNHVSNLPCHEDSAHIGRHGWCRRPRRDQVYKGAALPPHSLHLACISDSKRN